jgi:hypothetical protein
MQAGTRRCTPSSRRITTTGEKPNRQEAQPLLAASAGHSGSRRCSTRWMRSSPPTRTRRPLGTTTRSRGRLLLLGKGAVLAHLLARPFAAESDESEQRPTRGARICWLLVSTDAGVSARKQLTPARDDPRKHPATTCGRPLPGQKQASTPGPPSLVPVIHSSCLTVGLREARDQDAASVRSGCGDDGGIAEWHGRGRCRCLGVVESDVDGVERQLRLRVNAGFSRGWRQSSSAIASIASVACSPSRVSVAIWLA